MEFHPEEEPEQCDVQGGAVHEQHEQQGVFVLCWSCQASMPTTEAIRLRDSPLLFVPACRECWETMDTAQRITAAQETWNAEKLRLHREEIEKIVGGAAEAVKESIRREFE